MTKCSVCREGGSMVALHSSCLHDLLELMREQQPPLCDLCASVELCQQKIERTKPGEPLRLECRHTFRLDPGKAQAQLREAADEGRM